MRRLEARRRRTLKAIGDAYGAQLIDTRSMEWRVDAALRAGSVPALELPRAALPDARPALQEALRLLSFAGVWLAGTAEPAEHRRALDLGALAAHGRGGRWLVGRGPDCDVVVDASRRVSRRHCALVLRGGRWYVEDLGSANGTWLGERRVRSAPLGRLLPLRLADVALDLRGR